MTTLPVKAIQVGDRDRKPGDVSDLMASMTEVGLLHPVVVTPDGHLVAGGRRLEAARRLGWTEVDVTVISSLADAALALRAEQDENTCRRDLTPAEAERARQRRAKVLAPLAEQREKAGRPSAKLAQGSPDSRKTRNIAAQGTGYSGTTLDKVAKVREVAEDETQPDPVRQVAREAMTELDQPKAKVEPIHRKVAEAVAPNPIAAARAEVAKAPSVVAGKAVERFRLGVMTVEAAGGIDAILADLEQTPFELGGHWLPDLEKTVDVAGAFAAALRRRNVRSVQ